MDEHPVMHKLLELRFIIEKMRPLDGKLKHQIDRLLRQSAMEAGDEGSSSGNPSAGSALRPNLQSMVSTANESEGDSDREGGRDDEKREKYVAPKLVSMHYEGCICVEYYEQI